MRFDFLLRSLFAILLISSIFPSHSFSIEKQKSYNSHKKNYKLLKYFNNTDRKLGNRSAFFSLGDPRDAFAARIFLIDHAKKSLDLQYYIYENDQTGDFFSYHLVKAADRGVKVRILVDDLSTSGKDKEWKMMVSHPNIELRLFNPNKLRRSFRNLALLFNVDSLGKRMHNKALIVDNSAAIIGGRNIGDVYYAANNDTVFIDFDMLTIGSVVPKISKEFEIYWNCKESVPSKKILEANYTEAEYIQEAKLFKKRVDTFLQTSTAKAMMESRFLRQIRNHTLLMTVADKTDLYYDYPEKVTRNSDDTSTHISSQIESRLKKVDHKLVVISPYFVPSDEMLRNLGILRKKGVDITVITNSLASTDVFPVYSGYWWSIKDLLEMGVKLYELKPQSFKAFTKSEKWLKSHKTSLHTKMMIIDDDRLVVGSANIDPRSIKLNTELIMIIKSEKLAMKKRRELKKILNEDNFYKLSWGEYPSDNTNDLFLEKGPVWHSIENGKEKIYYSPPYSGFFRSFGASILSFLPIEGYL